jgi:hypothetical protein
LLVALAGLPAQAQISPGPLADAHASLEGASGCLRCHQRGKGVSASLCLDCHRALAERLAKGLGLHGRPDYARCETCHIEHHGREAKLVWWGEAGRDRFDHAQAGYLLEGKHATLECGQCHAPALLRDPAGLSRGVANPSRTFLGLGTACLDCHTDVHRGQLSGECRGCHGMSAWRPASGFDHHASAYRLTGRHETLACERCHPTVRDARGAYIRYRGIAFGTCSDCHRDPHGNRLGVTCERCHSTASWSVAVAGGGFDHDRTRYPLRGRHLRVSCDGCHRTTRVGRLAHERCTDCHGDTHRGELGSRRDGGACESCHDVDGFTPARFGLDDHAATRYPLQGAHQAVPCDGCHRRSPGRRVAPLHPAFERCTDCHRDPHGGEGAQAPKGPCTSCHGVDGWGVVTFDHGTTGYLLAGRHARVACDACHPRSQTTPPRLTFGRLTRQCAGCHPDPHGGQLTRGGQTLCERCHTADDWRAPLFDHGRDAAWALDGAHARVPCRNCHPTELRGPAPVIRFKPLPTRCRDCHSGAQP